MEPRIEIYGMLWLLLNNGGATISNMETRMNDLTIKPLSSDDCTEAYALELAAHAFPWRETLFRQSLTNHYQRMALWQHDCLIGLAFFQVVKPEVELLNLAIDPKVQGQGYGHYFLAALLKEFQKGGQERCFLEVRASNKAAIRLYERLNFNQMGVRDGYYPTKRGREDAYLYALELFW